VTVSGIPRPATSATAVLEHVRPGSDLIAQHRQRAPSFRDALREAARDLAYL
jgi:hypothetical protein